MWAGVDESRPYPPTGLTSALWLDIEPVMFFIRELTFTQRGVYFAALLEDDKPYGGDSYPHVVGWNGRLYLEDGHHRAMKILLNGGDSLMARLKTVGGTG